MMLCLPNALNSYVEHAFDHVIVGNRALGSYLINKYFI